MSLLVSFLRAAASAVRLTLALGLALVPAHPQERGATSSGMSAEPSTKAQKQSGKGPAAAKTPQPPGAGSSAAWVKLCDRGRLKGVAQDVDICRTLTEQIHPQTGTVLLGVTLQQAMLDGGQKHILSITVPQGAEMATGAGITVFPTDLWLKIQRNEKLGANDETRLKARSVKLAFKSCAQAGCVAETEATPLLVDMLKDNAGLLVHTLRQPRTPVSQPVSLAGFAQALEGPPTDSKRFKDAREQLMREIAARRKKEKNRKEKEM